MAREFQIDDPVLRAQMEDILSANHWEAGPNLLPQIMQELEIRRGSPLSNLSTKLVFRYFDEINGAAANSDEVNCEEEIADDSDGLQPEDNNCKKHVYQLHEPLAQLLGCKKMPFHKVLERVRRIVVSECSRVPGDPHLLVLSDRLANILGTDRVDEEELWPHVSPLMTAVEPDCPCCVNH